MSRPFSPSRKLRWKISRRFVAFLLLARMSKQKSKEEEAGPIATDGQGVLLWLRLDLRLHDNSALTAAARRASELGGRLTICYIHSPEEDGDDFRSGAVRPASTSTSVHHKAERICMKCSTQLLTGTSWRPTGAALVWLQASLGSLDKDLRERFGPGAGIIFRQGPYFDALHDITSKLGLGAVYYSRR